MITISTMRRRVLAAGGLTAAASVALVACTTVAPKADVEEQIRTRLSTATATCPGDLPGKVGSATTCTATAGGETFDVTVTVRSVAGGKIDVDIQRVGAGPASATPRPPDPAPVGAMVAGPMVATAVADQLAAMVGQRPDKVTCPDLMAAVGSSIRCELVAGRDVFGVTVTTSSVQGGRVQFDIKVDDAPR